MSLFDLKSLTPIEDTDAVWKDVTNNRDDCKHYQCKRMSSLFKKVYKDGTVKYCDVNRIVSYDLESSNPAIGFFSGCAIDIIDDMFPIKMPYIPDIPIKVYIREFLTDRNNGDFDTVSILYAIFPDGERKEINRYFKESENSWKEISENEMVGRQILHNDRLLKERGNRNA